MFFQRTLSSKSSVGSFDFTNQPLAIRMGRLRKLESQLTPDDLQALKLRSMRPKKGRIIATGVGLTMFVSAVYMYSMYATKATDDFERAADLLDQENKARKAVN